LCSGLLCHPCLPDLSEDGPAGGRARPAMAALSVLCALALSAVAHAGIYPEGHWEHATELTPDNADDFVKTNVDAGKTVFIRWIASEG